jgi:hypothetical protein
MLAECCELKSYGEAQDPKQRARDLLSSLGSVIYTFATEGMGDDGKRLDWDKMNEAKVNPWDLANASLLKELNVNKLLAVADKVRAELTKYTV